MEQKHTNSLINATSPYLLQHAHNPVDWRPWSNDALEQAKNENKLVLVSIGYAACHWCHVMEHESFEDEEVAEVMNNNFVCIKVDREERPDVDHYYMTAVQLMRQQGGWPLNVIAMPDGRPIWGGTYFPKEMWVKNLLAIAEFSRQKPDELENYAADLQNGIRQISLTADVENAVPVNSQLIENAVHKWKEKFDMELGGRRGQPKFPMPVNLEFLLRFGFIKKDEKALQFVKTTLEQMARGGIYDQIGGGFARYSVDDKWKVPHFEKMLYDNAQLLSVYSKGYQQFKKEEFKTVAYETVDFLKREMLDDSGAFYSSLDADSEGVEGKFYVWNKAELKTVFPDDFELFAGYFNINAKGLWEDGNYILLRNGTDEEFAREKNMTAEQLRKKVQEWKVKLMVERSKRVRPGLDDKTLTSWNALVIQGLADAYKAFQDDDFLQLAKQNAGFIKENILTAGGKLFHTWKNGKAAVDGFMEDYALAIQAFISLFEVSGEFAWLNNAIKMTEYCFSNFYDTEKESFFYAERNENAVVTNHYQNEDNVIPAANSVMASNLHKLYLIYGNPEYRSYPEKILKHVVSAFAQYPMAYSKWGELMMNMTDVFYEIVITGKDSQNMTSEMQTGFHPDVIWAFSAKKNSLPLFKGRFVKGKTLIYVCREGTCRLPVEDIEQALEMIKSENQGK